MSSFQCPLPLQKTDEHVLLAHGEGSGATRRLIHDRITPKLSNPVLDALGDAGRFNAGGVDLVMSTDSYVVSPLFFPGGDIGSLAVYGTVNDLLVSGGQPLSLTLGLVMEEGLPLDILDRVLASIGRACVECGVYIAAGDTKVVARGECDKLYINTTGVGLAVAPTMAGLQAIQPGDALIVTGPIGQHGIAIMASREQLDFTPAPCSDSRSVAEELAAIRPYLADIRAIRDATRGGIAAVLQEWAEASTCTLTLESERIPLSPEVSAISELLGLDPVHIACEGTLMIAVAAESADAVVVALREAGFTQAANVGRVRARDIVPVTRVNLTGHEQPLTEPIGAPLPRIC